MSIEVIVSLLLAIGFSFIRCFVDIQRSTKARTKACYSGAFFLFALMVIIGNSVTTLLASSMLKQQLPSDIKFMLPLFSAFAGVFAFESVLKHINITVYKKGAITIEEWITVARDNAQAASTAKEVQLIANERLAYSQKLMNIPEDQLNTYIAYYLGKEIIEQLDTTAKLHQLNPLLYKAMTLASDKPENVRALLQEVEKALTQNPPHTPKAS